MPNQDTSIFQEIDETDPEQCLQEVDRLIPKLRAFKSHQTSAYNVLANLVKASRCDNNRFEFFLQRYILKIVHEFIAYFIRVAHRPAVNN